MIRIGRDIKRIERVQEKRGRKGEGGRKEE
jgi:hypothetical protein